ncbi:MAG: hypothetical protein ACOY90_10155 [Candidatus Zhuqueibacterota bacterium]
MTTGKKIMIGGMGALTPIIMNLLAVDLNILLINVTIMAVFGYALRVVVLFYLGGVIAFLHKDEHSPVKIFELGIVAPALITALLNAGQVDVPKASLQSTKTHIGQMNIVASAYAQEPAVTDSVKTFARLRETGWQQLLRGLTGSRISSRHIWFVIAGSFEKLEDARAQALHLNEVQKEFTAVIYAPYDDDPNFKVVIGENLLYQQAESIKQRASQGELFKDLKLWRLPTDN